MKKIAISAMVAAAVLGAGARAMFAQEAITDPGGDTHVQAWYTGGPTADCHDACTTSVCCIK